MDRLKRELLQNKDKILCGYDEDEGVLHFSTRPGARGVREAVESARKEFGDFFDDVHRSSAFNPPEEYLAGQPPLAPGKVGETGGNGLHFSVHFPERKKWAAKRLVSILKNAGIPVTKVVGRFRGLAEAMRRHAITPVEFGSAIFFSTGKQEHSAALDAFGIQLGRFFAKSPDLFLHGVPSFRKLGRPHPLYGHALKLEFDASHAPGIRAMRARLRENGITFG